jgi:hypothetical protein
MEVEESWFTLCWVQLTETRDGKCDFKKTPTAGEPHVVRSIGSFDFDYIGSTSGGMIQLVQALYHDFKQGRIKG